MANPFALSRWFHRLGNAFIAPLFRLGPMPAGFALLTVTGRKTGRPLTRPVRAVRRDDTLYAVALLGERSDWLRNARAKPEITVKLGSRRFEAHVRELADPAERDAAADLFVREVVRFDYVDYTGYEWAFPTRRSIQNAHRRWLEKGTLVVIDLDRPLAKR